MCGDALRTEGQLPDGRDMLRTISSVKSSTGIQMGDNVDGLQRALEREVVDHLRGQNSRFMDELMFLRGKLETRSGMESSPWSAVGGMESIGI